MWLIDRLRAQNKNNLQITQPYQNNQRKIRYSASEFYLFRFVSLAGKIRLIHLKHYF